MSSPQWGWVRLFGAKRADPDENGRNSETKRAIWTGPTPKRSQRRGLQTPLRQKNGVPYQKTDFRAEVWIFGPKKKNSLFNSNHVPAMTGQSCQKEKVPFSQMNIGLSAFRGWLLWRKTDFRPVFRLSAKRKNGRFSVIFFRTTSVGPPNYFLGAPDIPAKFRRPRIKIRGTSESKVGIAKNGQNPGRRPKNGPPSAQTATYRKTKSIQSYLRIWGRYYPIESGPSDPKKWGLYGCSVKKCRFLQIFGPKMGPGVRPEARRATQSTQKRCLFGVQS